MELNVNVFVGEPSSSKSGPRTSNNPRRTRTMCLENRRVLEGGSESWRTYNPDRFSVQKKVFGQKKCNRPMQGISFDGDYERLQGDMYEDWKISDRSRENNYRMLATDFTRSRSSKILGKNNEHYGIGIVGDYGSRRSKIKKSYWDYEDDFSVRGCERYVRVASYDILYPRNSKAKDWAPFSSEDFLSRTRIEFDETFDNINDTYYQESSDSEGLILDPDSRIVSADHQSFSYNPRPKAVDKGKRKKVELFEIFESGRQDQNPSTYWIRHKNVRPSEQKVYKDSKLQSCIKEPKRTGNQTFANDLRHNLKSFSGFECESYPNLAEDRYRSEKNWIIREDKLKICNKGTEKTNWSMDVNYGIQDNLESDGAKYENRCQNCTLAKLKPNTIEKLTHHNTSKHDSLTAKDEFNQYSPICELVLSGTISPNPSVLRDMVQENFLINVPAPQLSTSSEDEDDFNEIVLSEESSGKSSSRLSDEEGKKDDNQHILEQTEVMEICLPAESESSNVNVVRYSETLNQKIENDSNQRRSCIASHKSLKVNLEPLAKPKLVEKPEKNGQRYCDDVIQCAPSQTTLTQFDVISPIAPECRGNEVESLTPAMVDSWDVISPKKVVNIKYASEMCYSHEIAGLKSVEFGIVTNESIDVVSKTRKVRPQTWKYRGKPSNLLTVSKAKNRRRSVGVTLGSKEEKCADNEDTALERRKSVGGIERKKSPFKYETDYFMNCLKKNASSRGLV